MLTTVIELVGVTLVIAGLSLFLAQWSVPGGIVLAGTLALAFSVFVEKPWRKRP